MCLAVACLFPSARRLVLAAARLLCDRTLWLKDTDQPHTPEAAMCKWWAPKVAYDWAELTGTLARSEAGRACYLPGGTAPVAVTRARRALTSMGTPMTVSAPAHTRTWVSDGLGV